MTYRLCRRCRSAVAMAWSLRSVNICNTTAFCHTRVVPAADLLQDPNQWEPEDLAGTPTRFIRSDSRGSSRNGSASGSAPR